MSEIQNFYAGQNVFITGGTGFIGKILVEKLIRGCPGIGTIYLLMRQKKDKSIQERLSEMTNSALFEPLRKINPDFEKQIIPIHGDVGQPGFALSPADYVLLIKEVSIVFHAAATVKFDDPLRKVVPINVNSVMEIIKICKECKNLKAAVYLSTAFSQCTNHYIEEKIYRAPLTYEQINNLVQITESSHFSEEEEKTEFTSSILGEIPNTYILTKQIAEGLLNEKARDLPFCIFRFSIALATLKEPVPGWTDTIQGFNQFMSGIAFGLIRVMRVNWPGRIDIIPADFACNALITSAWETNISKKSMTDDLPVYNFVSGTDNPLNWTDIGYHFEEVGPLNPPTKMIYFPTVFRISSPILLAILDFILHLIPALLGDCILRMMGRKPMLHEIYRKGNKLRQQMDFVSQVDYSFETTRVRSMWDRLLTTDKELFPFDVKTINWMETISIFWRGILQYAIKDDFSTKGRVRALRRYLRLYVVHQIVKFTFMMFLLWLTWKLFCVVRILF